MGVHPIEETLQMTDPAKGFLFDLVFENLLGDKGINGQQFELRAQSYSFPGEKVEVISMNIGGNPRHDAALKDRSGTWSTEIIETQDADGLERFESWLQLMHDLGTGITGFSTEYKVDVTVRMLNAKLQPVKTRKLKRCWPTNTSELNFSANSKEKVSLKIGWQFDWWE